MSLIFICEVIDLPLTVHFWRTDFPFILCPIKSNIYVYCWGIEEEDISKLNLILTKNDLNRNMQNFASQFRIVLGCNLKNKNAKTNTSSSSHIHKDKGKQRQRQTKVLAHLYTEDKDKLRQRRRQTKTILYVFKSTIKIKDKHRQMYGQTKVFLTYRQKTTKTKAKAMTNTRPFTQVERTTRTNIDKQ